MAKNERYKQLEKAVQYAIDSNYIVYNRQLELLNQLKTHTNICIFGFGRFFIEGYPYVKKLLNAKYVCDNHIDKAIEEGRQTYGLTCLHMEQLEMLDDVFVVIMVGKDYLEIKQELDDKELENIYLGDLILNMYTTKHNSAWFVREKENILGALELFEDNISQENYVEIICNRIAPHLSKKSFENIKTEGEYFSTGLLQYNAQEIFVDVGAYIGDTIEQFQNQVIRKHSGYKKIYAFELENVYLEQLKATVQSLNLENVEIFNKGISEKDDELNSMVCLDTMFSDREFTLIKMDIEGYEWGALHGGKNVIRKWKPKMAICLYHCLEDLWRIPQYVKELDSGYQLYLRHHSPVVWDSVLYATTK